MMEEMCRASPVGRGDISLFTNPKEALQTPYFGDGPSSCSMILHELHFQAFSGESGMVELKTRSF